MKTELKRDKDGNLNFQTPINALREKFETQTAKDCIAKTKSEIETEICNQQLILSEWQKEEDWKLEEEKKWNISAAKEIIKELKIILNSRISVIAEKLIFYQN